MKITDIKTFIIHPAAGIRTHASFGYTNLCFVKVETDEGIHGWGECYTRPDRDTVLEVHIRKLTRYLQGWNPFEIKRFTHMAYEDWATKRGSMELYCAISGIEQALWDIVGKTVQQPVYNLLGGPCRSSIRVYANGWSDGAKSPAELGAKAQAVIKKGFTALKFDPLKPRPWRLYISRADERRAVKNVKAVREAVGPEVDILIEVHRRLAPMHAIRLATMLEPYQPFWYEEPAPSENLDAIAEIRRNITIPVVTGECLYAKAGFREVLEQRAADILNPDVCNTGGILELKEIAAMAEPYFVAVAPHNYNSTTVGLATSIHAAAVMTNFLILEYFVSFEALGADIATKPFHVEQGYIQLPKEPGLGIDLNEDKLRAYPYQEFPQRTIAHYLT